MIKMNCRRQRPFSRHLILVTFLTFIAFMSDTLTSACPSFCVCKWKGGKQTVECGDRLLSSIPEGMDAGTQVLNFSGNSLQVLQSERFLNMELTNLQKIFLSRNQLIKIHDKAFRGLSNLVELDLADNMLQQVPSETFQDYTSLMRLSLSGNPIRELRTAAFRYLAFLTTLELSNCQIERVENEAFIGMDNLEWLRLDGNRISFIQGSHILPKSLHGINLQSNRWTCDCRLTDVHAWLINYNTPQEEEPRCVEPPRLKGQVIKSLKKDELACLPDIIPKSSYTEIMEGRNISLMCTVRAIPEATVLWLFNGQVLTNDSLLENLHMYYYIDESGGEEKKSEVFIYNVGPEDNGTFSCIGRNTAGTSFSNYTIRVIVKEMPIAKEVSFSRNYMNIIIASGGGAGIIFVLLLCTIIINCRRKSPKNTNRKTDTSSNDSGLLKCPSIINEEDMSPKTSKENGLMMGEGAMKQNFLVYVPTMPTGGHIMDNGSMQLAGTVSSSPPLNPSNSHDISVSGIPTQYCSPPSSLRNYQDKNPDLVNDAESVKNKMKNDSEYEGSDCSTGPCSIQGTFDNCYQLPGQFGSQIIRPSGMSSRFAPPTLSTMPRGLHAKPGGQHQVDVHLNPVCFLGQDGFAYDYSNNHMHNAGPAVAMNQQNFYRTLPHNRSHNKIFASASNPGARYSLEAEFLQRTGTPTYDQYAMQNVRFTAEGYPLHPVKFPSPPEGYRTAEFTLTSGDPLNGGQSFQKWPPCLPGYHAQPIRYSASVPPSGQVICSAPSVVASRTPSQQSQTQSHQGNQQTPGTPPSQAVVTSSATQTPTTSTSTATTEVKKRCVGAQTSELDPDTIPEVDEDTERTKLRHLTGPLADSPDEGYVGDSQESSDI